MKEHSGKQSGARLCLTCKPEDWGAARNSISETASRPAFCIYFHFSFSPMFRTVKILKQIPEALWLDVQIGDEAVAHTGEHSHHFYPQPIVFSAAVPTVKMWRWFKKIWRECFRFTGAWNVIVSRIFQFSCQRAGKFISYCFEAATSLCS
jgi:hypothetical protein